MKEYYDKRAPEYDDWWLGRGLFAGRERPGWQESLAELGTAIAALPAARTLDVACGTGFLTQHLRGDIVGLDQSASMLAEATTRLPHVTLLQGDALSLPFPDHSFDRVFTSFFYCHLEETDRRRFLAEARRVAHELVIVASVPGEGDPHERWEERVLKDASTWQVYKRVFEPEALAAELGGEVLLGGEWFVVVRTTL
jgi:ubiquinone/menaquinone biosynthesis C-methylase UbiE